MCSTDRNKQYQQSWIPVLFLGVFLTLLSACSAPLSLSNDTKLIVEAGLSEVRLSSSSFTQDGLVKSNFASNETVTAQINLINPKNLAVSYTIASNLDSSNFVSAPTTPVATSPTSATFSFKLSAIAEHKDVVFTIGKVVASTGKTYDNDTLKVHCDSPPDPVENLSIGKDATSKKPIIAFSLPVASADDDLLSATIQYQDLTTMSAITSVTLGLSSSDLTTVTTPDLLSSVSAVNKRYFAPNLATGDTYAFVVYLNDASGQKSTTKTVGADGINYTLSYNANGGSGTVATATYAYGASATIAANAFTYTGYRFNGWNTAANGSGTSYVVGDTSLIMNQGNLVLYAQWIPVYSITYDGNGNTGGSVPVDSSQYAATDSVTVLDNTGGLEKTGYTFKGWKTSASSTVTAYQPADALVMGAAARTLYASWIDVTAPTGSVPGITSVANYCPGAVANYVGGLVTFCGTVSDSGSGVASVVVNINSVDVTGTVSGNTYTVLWDSSSFGTSTVDAFTYTVTAADNSGNTAQIRTGSITADNRTQYTYSETCIIDTTTTPSFHGPVTCSWNSVSGATKYVLYCVGCSINPPLPSLALIEDLNTYRSITGISGAGYSSGSTFSNINNTEVASYTSTTSTTLSGEANFRYGAGAGTKWPILNRVYVLALDTSSNILSVQYSAVVTAK